MANAYTSLPLGLLSSVPPPPQAPQAPKIPTPPDGGFRSFSDYVNAFQQGNRDGGDFGGGAYGVAQSEADRMGAGTAPASVAGITAALGNAFSLMGGAAPVTTGIKSMMEMAMGKTPGTLGGLQNIPGQTPFDPDLVAAVKAQKMHLSQAVALQAQRNGERSAQAARDQFDQAAKKTGYSQTGGLIGAGLGYGGNNGYGGALSGGGNATAGGWGGEKI